LLLKGSRLRSRPLAVVSNRLPVTIDSQGSATMSSGGLVTALSPVLRRHGGQWIGWTGTETTAEEALASFSKVQGYSLKAVDLNPNDVEAFYYGFSNEVLWPLFHGFPCRCRFEPEFWRAYERVNETFAATIAAATDPSDFVWVQDYHLLLVAQKLRSMGIKRDCGFYLHIPFPHPDLFFCLPWRDQIVSGLADYDFLGFQTSQDRENFCSCLQSTSSSDSRAPKDQPAAFERTHTMAAPISIDFDEFANEAESCRREPEASCIGPLNQGCRTLLGVDRLDYTKGIPERLRAYRQLLQDFPEHRKKTTLLQVVVPSRERIEAYQQLKIEIERLVGEINGQFATPGWTPIRYLYRSLSRRELVSTYIRSDLAVVTPLRDGMNLVAKEYCACTNDLNGALLLSEFAGASRQLQDGAILVNPYDIEALAQAMNSALRLSRPERRARMFAARERIRAEDIGWWIDRCLGPVRKADMPSRTEPKRNRMPGSSSRERRAGLKPPSRQSSRQSVPRYKAQKSLRTKSWRTTQIGRPESVS